VHAQQRADRVLSTATSDEAYQAGLRMLQREVDAVERSPRDALEEIRKIFGEKGVAKEGSTGERYGKSGWAKEGDVDVKPEQVEQNGHIYRLGPDGNYHPVQ
jgi:hypothetical protein